MGVQKQLRFGVNNPGISALKGRHSPWLYQLPAETVEPFAPKANQPAGHFHLEQIVQWLETADKDHRPWDKAQFSPVTQPGGVVVLNFAYDNPLTVPKL